MASKKSPTDTFQLNPCPFCGAELIGKEELWRNPHTNITKKQMVYSHPKTNCVLDYHRYHFYADPWKVDAWNRRYKEPQEIDFDYEAED